MNPTPRPAEKHAQDQPHSAMGCRKVALVIAAVLIPPLAGEGRTWCHPCWHLPVGACPAGDSPTSLFPSWASAVAIKQDKLDNVFWLNLVLTLLAWLPGALHGVWVVLGQPEPDEMARPFLGS